MLFDALILSRCRHYCLQCALNNTVGQTVMSPQDLFETRIRRDTIHAGRENRTRIDDEWVQKLNEASDRRIQDLMSAPKQYEELFRTVQFSCSAYSLKCVLFGPKLDPFCILH